MFKYVTRYEKDLTRWFRTNIINQCKDIKVYHKIADDSKGLSSQKPFDSFMLYKGVFCALEYKLLPPYKTQGKMHGIKILEKHQNESLFHVSRHNIGLVVVNVYDVWRDDITGKQTGLDLIYIYTYEQILNEEKPKIVKKNTAEVYTALIEVLESELRRIRK